MDTPKTWGFSDIPLTAGVPHSGTPSSHSMPNTAYIVGGTAAVVGGWPLVFGVA
ncbi:hypothetical protein T440DRAFT_363557, partial [Plenodomus tracheiphilus IPT5]